MSLPAINLDDIQAAAGRIGQHIVRTPCLHSERISRALDCRVHFKAENLQHVGAFKTRGAVNAVLQLEEPIASRGVVTHSSGNHAAALARAAGIRGIPAYVVMPQNSAKNKIESVRSYGVEPIFCEPNAESRAATAESVRQRTHATLIHPYDYAPVIAGQGTVGLEILEQVADLHAVIAPVGGGGLLSGILTAIKALHPDVAVYAAEPSFADDAYRSLRSGRIEMPTRVDTIADGLRTPLGQLTFPIIQSHVRDILLVSEDGIRQAMRALVEQAKLVAEPSGAVALAALMEHADKFSGQNVAIVISGGNLDMGSCSL